MALTEQTKSHHTPEAGPLLTLPFYNILWCRLNGQNARLLFISTTILTAQIIHHFIKKLSLICQTEFYQQSDLPINPFTDMSYIV